MNADRVLPFRRSVGSLKRSTRYHPTSRLPIPAPDRQVDPTAACDDLAGEANDVRFGYRGHDELRPCQDGSAARLGIEHASDTHEKLIAKLSGNNPDHLQSVRRGHGHFHRGDTAREDRLGDVEQLVRGIGSYDGNDPRIQEAVDNGGFIHRGTCWGSRDESGEGGQWHGDGARPMGVRRRRPKESMPMAGELCEGAALYEPAKSLGDG